MGSHAQDKTTQTAASQGAQAQDQQLATNAAKNQQYADQTRQSLFGTQDASGKYTGGSVSQFLDPSALNQSGLNGTYLNQYNNASNNLANQTKNAVGTTMQNLASRGMGKTPAGFAADEQRRAYQSQAGQQGDLYSSAANQQHSDALTNYWNATNMQNANATNTANLSLAGNQAAAGNYASLYGTASTQVQSPWATALGVLGQAGGAAAGAYAAGK